MCHSSDLFVLEKSTINVMEISPSLVIENYEIFATSKEAIEKLSSFIGKIKIRLSVQVLVIWVSVIM